MYMYSPAAHVKQDSEVLPTYSHGCASVGVFAYRFIPIVSRPPQPGRATRRTRGPCRPELAGPMDRDLFRERCSPYAPPCTENHFSRLALVQIDEDEERRGTASRVNQPVRRRRLADRAGGLCRVEVSDAGVQDFSPGA